CFNAPASAVAMKRTYHYGVGCECLLGPASSNLVLTHPSTAISIATTIINSQRIWLWYSIVSPQAIFTRSARRIRKAASPATIQRHPHFEGATRAQHSGQVTGFLANPNHFLALRRSCELNQCPH